MDTSYFALINQLDSASSNRIKQSQSDWLAYLESENSLADRSLDLNVGFMYDVIAANNKLEVVRTRALQLMRYETLFFE